VIKKLNISLLVLLVLAGGYFVTIMYSTGFFRKIENRSFGKTVAEIPLPGPEDLTIDYESGLMFISSFDRAGDVRGEDPTGGIFLLDLNTPNYEPLRLDDGLGKGFHPHGIHLLKIDSITSRLLVVNHQNGKHTIELFEFIRDDHFAHLRTFKDPLIVSPNDIVAMDADRFYFTNDHGKTEGLGLLAENYLGLPFSGVVYFDGETFREVADGISYANGITHKDHKQLLVASPRKFKLLTYDILPDGSLSKTGEQEMSSGIDNLEWDKEGNLWTGAHPNLLRFAAYAKLKKTTSPSEIIKISNGQMSSIYLNDGTEISGSTIAVPFGNRVFVGNVMDEKILVIEKD
jgi:arylesterase/paraoxonase